MGTVSDDPKTLRNSIVTGLFTHSPAPAVIVDAAGLVLEANEAASVLLGQRLQALVGLDLGAVFPADAVNEIVTTGRRVAGHAGPVGGTVQVPARRGGTLGVDLEIVAFPLGPGQGQPLVLLLRDVTARNQDQTQLRFRTALLESQSEASMDGILVVDHQGVVVSVNQRLYDLWGIPSSLVPVGAKESEAFRAMSAPLADPEAYRSQTEWLRAHPTARSHDEVHFTDGRVFERWSTPVVGADGTAYGRGWYFRDVTERAHRTAELKRAYDAVKDSERFRTELMNTVSHDLGTPMTPIKLQVHLLRQLKDLPDQAGRALEIIDRNVTQLQRLVTDLADVARLEAGALQLETEAVDLADVVRDAVESYWDAAAEAGVGLETRVLEPLPVMADPHRVTQVLFNLLTNAVKFSKPGHNVTVEGEIIGNEVRVRVRDTGRGLTQPEIAVLFKPFSQVHEPGSVHERGTGLGLFICRALLERQAGRIWIESGGHGTGSTFIVGLPRRAEQAARP